MNKYNYILVPKVVELISNVSSFPGFKFGTYLYEIKELNNYKGRIKLHYFVNKNIDQTKYFKDKDFLYRYREVLVKNPPNVVFYEKYLSPFIKLQYLVNIERMNSIEVYVNRFYHKYWRIPIGHLYPPGIILHNLLAMALILNGYAPICFSAVKVYDKSFLLIGISGSGKSLLICKITKEGGKVISEDNLVIDKNGNIYPVMYMPTNTKSLETTLRFCNVNKILKNRMSLFDVFGKENVSTKEEKISGVIFLERGDPSVEEISFDEGIRRLFILNKGNYFYETIPLTQALMFFNKKFRGSREREKEILKKALEKSVMMIIRWKRIEDLYINFRNLAREL